MPSVEEQYDPDGDLPVQGGIRGLEPERPETPKQTVTPKTPTKSTTTIKTESTVSKTKRPKTGDDMRVVLFTILLIGAGAGVTGVGVAKKKGLL